MRQSLDTYDTIPEAMRRYLSYNGFHFNKKACDYAVRKMRKGGNKIEPWTQDQVNELLKKYGITIKNDTMHDATYVANMAKSDFLGKSLPNEQYLAMYIKDYLDDEDGTGEEAFRRWIADCVGRGEPVDFEMLL